MNRVGTQAGLISEEHLSTLRLDEPRNSRLQRSLDLLVDRRAIEPVGRTLLMPAICHAPFQRPSGESLPASDDSMPFRPVSWTMRP